MEHQLADFHQGIKRIICLSFLFFKCTLETFAKGDTYDTKLYEFSLSCVEDARAKHANLIIAYTDCGPATNDYYYEGKMQIIYRIDSVFFYRSFIQKVNNGKLASIPLGPIKLGNECVQYDVYKEYQDSIHWLLKHPSILDNDTIVYEGEALLKLHTSPARHFLYFYQEGKQYSNKFHNLSTDYWYYKRVKPLWLLLSSFSNIMIYYYDFYGKKR